PWTEMAGAPRRDGHRYNGTCADKMPVAWNCVRLMLLTLKLRLAAVFSDCGVYMGNVPPVPLDSGVVKAVQVGPCSIYGRIITAQEILCGRPPVRPKGSFL